MLRPGESQEGDGRKKKEPVLRPGKSQEGDGRKKNEACSSGRSSFECDLRLFLKKLKLPLKISETVFCTLPGRLASMMCFAFGIF